MLLTSDRPPITRWPLHIYVAWHPSFTRGQIIAGNIYSSLAHPVTDVLARGPGIPVLFRSAPPDGSPVPKPVRFHHAEHILLVLLVDDGMLLDAEWRTWACDALLAAREDADGRHVVLPLGLSPHADKLLGHVAPLQVERMDTVDRKEWRRAATISVTHACARMLLHEESRQANDTSGPSSGAPGPVNLFLSHATRDGFGIARALNNYIRARTDAGAFFAAREIAKGYDFPSQLDEAVSRSAVIAIQTDAYGEREWCQRELLTAKRCGVPLVVVNSVTRGEQRMFPYVGNAPTLRWDPRGPDRSADVVALALREVVRCEHFSRYARALQEMGRIPPHAKIMRHAPELLTCLPAGHEPRSARPRLVIYPDPPISAAETHIVETFARVSIATPTNVGVQGCSLPGTDKPSLRGREIGLSVGRSADIASLGSSRLQFTHMLMEIARHLLIQGARLAYGGDLRKGGFSRHLGDLVRYHHEQQPDIQPIVNYHASFYEVASAQAQAECLGYVDVVKVPNRGQDNPVDALTSMREEMARNAFARIAIGGKTSAYWGRYPGIEEETRLAVERGSPIYLLGGFGGMTRVLTRRAIRRAFGAHGDEKGWAPTHDEFRNGLDFHANIDLMETQVAEEAIELILRGLANVLAAEGGRATSAA